MRTTPLRRSSRLEPGPPPVRRKRLKSVSDKRAEACNTASRTGISPEAGSGIKSAATKKSRATSRSGESFPPAVAALLAARDPWCVHCGSPHDLHNHHRRIKGSGGDPRPHTGCACVGVRICRSCHEFVHSGDGRREAEAEGLIIPRSTTEPWTKGVLVHTPDGGMTKYPSCSGEWLDEVPGRDAA
jgi:hypothetical protein